MRTLLAVALLSLLFALPVMAQQSTTAPSMLIGGGFGYSSAAEDPYSGHLFVAKSIDDAKYNYSINYVDFYPVVKNGKLFFNAAAIQTTYARKFAFGKVNFYGLAGVGAAIGGDQVGFAWTAGGALPFNIKGPFYVIPNVRVLKDDIGGGYSGLFGVSIALGAK